MTVKRLRIQYTHSKFWLIFWLLVLFPVGLVLLFNHTQLVSQGQTYKMQYHGKRFWLYFWAVVFFPVMILLTLFNSSFLKIS